MRIADIKKPLKLHIIPPHGPIKAAEIAPGEDELQKLQGYCQGYIEYHPVMYGGARRIAYINEDGRAARLPYNWHASLIAGRTIVGTMVIVVAGGPSTVL